MVKYVYQIKSSFIIVLLILDNTYIQESFLPGNVKTNLNFLNMFWKSWPKFIIRLTFNIKLYIVGKI